MMENDTGDKKPEPGRFYTYRGDKAAGQAQAIGAEPGEAVAGPDAASTKETPEPDAQPDKGHRRSMIIAITLTVLLAAAVLLAVILDPGRLGLSGALAPTDAAAPTKTSNIKPVKTGSTDAALFLYGQPWDDKKHDSMKSLKKVTNLRYALAFLQEFTPTQIKAVPAIPCALADVALNYKQIAGSLVSFTVKITAKDALTEELETQSNQPSTLLTLPGDVSYGSASLIVTGSDLASLKAGDSVQVSCIPIYFYTPKDSGSVGGLLFITIPELVSKTN